MWLLLEIAGFLTTVVGDVHSVLGERYILMRPFRRTELPKLFGSTEFTARVLRFAWHLTTVAWWGFAAMLFLLASGLTTARNLSFTMAATFLASGAITLGISRGKHLARPVFCFIGGVCLYAAMA